MVLAPFIALLACDARFVADGDYAAFFLPFEKFSRDEMVAGRFPLWMPYLACGEALHASQHAALLYPPSISSVLLFGANSGVKISLFLHLAICFVGQYALARHLVVSRPAACFAAIGAVWGTFAMDHLAAGHVTFVFGYALIPWFFWLLLRMLARPRAATAAALAGLTALFELGSHPQMFYYALVGGACWLAGWFLSAETAKTRLRALAWLAVATAITILISAAQWLPAAELAGDGLARGERGAADHAAMYAMDGSDLARLFVPRFKGDMRVSIEPLERRGYDHERGAYLGILVLPLAVFGLSRLSAASWQWGAAWFCVVAAAVALADHSPLWGLFHTTVPGLRWFRCQGRIFSVVNVIAPLLAARGLDALVIGEREGGRAARWHLLGLGCAAAALFTDALRRWLLRFDWHDYMHYASVHLRDEYWKVGLTIALIAVLLSVSRPFAREFPGFTYILFTFALMGELYEYNVRQFQLVPSNEYFQLAMPKGIRASRFVLAPRDLAFKRISLQYSRAVPLAVGSRTPAINTFDGAVLPASVERLFAAIERRPGAALALASCDSAYIQSERRWRALPGALPRFRFVRDPAAALCARPIDQCGDDHVTALREALAGAVNMRLEKPRRQEFDVDAPEAGMFVVADAYYPGWRCTVDGQEISIGAVHGVFRGVRLSAGQHRVEFVYQPRSFQLGLALSAIGLAILIGMIVGAIRSEKRRTR